MPAVEFTLKNLEREKETKESARAVAFISHSLHEKPFAILLEKEFACIFSQLAHLLFESGLHDMIVGCKMVEREWKYGCYTGIHTHTRVCR